MTPHDEQHDSALARTPAVERLLARLRARLTRQVWLFGIGSLLIAASIWLAFAFLADWALHVPTGVRWLHLLVLVALPVFVLWRELWRHLRRRPDRSGLAVLIEREHPDLHELLVSAVQLQQQREPAGAPELVDRVLEQAEERARVLDPGPVLDGRPSRNRFALGAALAAGLIAVGLAQPAYTSIFLQRLVGGEVPWPQLTRLEVSIPNLDDRARIERTSEAIDVTVARGTDVPVLVRAEGKVPREVTLHFAGGHEVLVGSSGGGVFRTMLRSCQEDVSFHVTGGDDRNGLPRVSIRVLEPPDVGGLAIAIEPPAYTGLPRRVEFDHDVEVLAGTHLSVAMLPHPADAVGRVRILPVDRELELTPMDFPAASAEEAPRPGLGFEWVAESSLRFRFELHDASGLSNPDPGLFAVQVVADRTPEVQLISPGRLEIDTIPGGALALRARVDDDFGIARMVWTSRPAADETPTVHPLAFADLPTGGDAPGHAAIGAERIAVDSLLPADRDPEGELVLLSVRAQDNRPGAPENALEDPGNEHPSVGTAPGLRVRIVSEDEFMQRLQDRLSRLRIKASELEQLQAQKQQRTAELIAALESDEPEPGASGAQVNAALTGQRRVGGDASVITRELAAVLEGVVYARIEEQGDALLEDLDARLAAAATRKFEVQPWIDLAATWSEPGTTAPGLAGQLLSILDLSLTISETDVPAVVAALERANESLDLAQIHANLLEATAAQDVARGHMDELLGRLAEWDNFQSILSLTRDILNRQKSLRERTAEFAREK